jgi:hypothetical protein
MLLLGQRQKFLGEKHMRALEEAAADDTAVLIPGRRDKPVREELPTVGEGGDQAQSSA